MKTKASIRDVSLLLVSILALLWGWKCFSPTEGISPSCVVRNLLHANDNAGVTVPSSGEEVTIDLVPKPMWIEHECVLSRNVLNKGLATSATVTNDGVLVVRGSVAESGTHLTTVTVQTRAEDCKAPLTSPVWMTEVLRIPVNFE